MAEPQATGDAIGSFRVEAGFQGLSSLPPMPLDVAVAGVSGAVPPSLIVVGYGLSDPIKAYPTTGGSSSTTTSG